MANEFATVLEEARSSQVSEWVEETLQRAVAWARVAVRTVRNIHAEPILIAALLQNPFANALMYFLTLASWHATDSP